MNICRSYWEAQDEGQFLQWNFAFQLHKIVSFYSGEFTLRTLNTGIDQLTQAIDCQIRESFESVSLV